ncbi:MAG: transporter [Acidobacteriota bacterium]
MRKWLITLVAVFVANIAWAQDPERAIKTETAELVPIGSVRADLGLEFLHRARYSLSGFEGDLLRMGTISFHIGVGDYAEFQLSGVGRDFLTITKRAQAILPTTVSGDTTSDFGDLILGAKLRFAPEKGARPAIAFKFAVQLPNATNESGLGTDETEFYSSMLFSKHIGKAQVSGNVGLAILGSPVQPNSQADMLTYGLGITVPLHAGLELIGEVSGRQGPAHRIGNEDLSQAQAGVRLRVAGLRWDLAGVAGLKHFNPGSGLSLDVSYEFQAFHKKRGPVTIRPEKPPIKK